MTVALLAAIGGCEPQLETHIPATLQAGATRTEIIALLIHLTPYVGIPRSLNALYLAKRLFAEEPLAGSSSSTETESQRRFLTS